MFKILVWVKKKEGMDDAAFREYWLERHAPITRRAYSRLDSYQVNLVTRLPREGAAFNGLAELLWSSKADFDTDVRSQEASAVIDDMKNFASAWGTLFVEEHEVALA